MYKSLHSGQAAHQTGAYPGFCSMKRLGVFLLPPGWDASPSQGHPSIKFAGTHLYTWVERGTVRLKCLAQEHNTMSPARTRTRSTGSGVERAKHEATAPPPYVQKFTFIMWLMFSTFCTLNITMIQIMTVWPCRPFHGLCLKNSSL